MLGNASVADALEDKSIYTEPNGVTASLGPGDRIVPMNTQRRAVTLVTLAIVFLALTPVSVVCAAPLSPTKSILPMAAGVEKRVTPSSRQVTVSCDEAANPGIAVAIQPGDEGYPGVRIAPEGTSWDLSRYGHVEARLVNTGAKPISLALRVDNSGDWHDNPWNAEGITLAPGESGTATVIFGYAYGYKPGYALKPSAIVSILIFAGKSESAQSFRIESLIAGGPAREQPPIEPDAVRTKPAGGKLLGTGVAIDAGKQIATQGATATVSNGSIRVAAESGQSVSFKPAIGRWDLRDYLEVRVKFRNAGAAAVTPRARIASNGGTSDWVASKPTAPGASGEVTIPFAGSAPAMIGKNDTGSHVTSDAVSEIALAFDGKALVDVLSVEAADPPTALPAWLGKRPPVSGDWVKTLDDEFNGDTLDRSAWDISGENYWDKQSHWSKDDVIVGKGVAALRYEKKTGFNNDDPKQKPSGYAAGYLHTYNRWAQRYGYFEARMKLPKAPGLWPAFWMMPDRGKAAGEQWKRQDTGNGGMEFDIMEHLTRWGPHRYNIAMHYDGYGKDHKSVGSDKIYVRPDKDGYITCGLLWTPGSAIYYCNGQEVLRWKDARISNVPEILMFTIPQGGWDNSPVDDKTLPDQFTIDYVRVWQRKDLASPGDGKMSAN